MINIDRIQQYLVDGASLEEAQELAASLGIESHIEDDILVLDGVVLTTTEHGELEVSNSSSIEEALEEAWEEEASYLSPKDLPCVVAVKAFHPAFTVWGAWIDFEPQWKIRLIEEEEPPCSKSEHEWISPIEVVGGIPDNPGVWANNFGGVSITEICPNCGVARYKDTLWQHPATGTVWENVTRYDYQTYRDAALQWAASQEEQEA